MPDVVIVGGGIIGAACAYELASGGASVLLLEREELAAGASGRNNGLWLTPTDPSLLPMARATLRRYLEIAGESPVPLRLDEAPIGLRVPISGARGWLVRLDVDGAPLQRLLASAGWEEAPCSGG